MTQRNFLNEFVSGGFISLLKVILLAISVQNTWAFIRTPEFVPNQAITYSILLLAIYEGGLLYWLHVATHISNNPARYLIAWLLFIISFIAVAAACIYEMNGAVFMFDHAFFTQYAHLVTSNTLLIELLMLLVYQTVNHHTYLHHVLIKSGGFFGELLPQGGTARVPYAVYPSEQDTAPDTARLTTRVAQAWDTLWGKPQAENAVPFAPQNEQPRAGNAAVYPTELPLPQDDYEETATATASSSTAKGTQKPDYKLLISTLLRTHPELTNVQLMEATGASQRTVEKYAAEYRKG